MVRQGVVVGGGGEITQAGSGSGSIAGSATAPAASPHQVRPAQRLPFPPPPSFPRLVCSRSRCVVDGLLVAGFCLLRVLAWADSVPRFCSRDEVREWSSTSYDFERFTSGIVTMDSDDANRSLTHARVRTCLLVCLCLHILNRYKWSVRMCSTLELLFGDSIGSCNRANACVWNWVFSMLFVRPIGCRRLPVAWHLLTNWGNSV